MMRKPKKKRKENKKIGLPPGSLIYTGDKFDVEPYFEYIYYTDGECEGPKISKTVLTKNSTENTKHWLNYVGLHAVENIEAVGKQYNIEPLILEDILSTKQRPKYEGSLQSAFVTLKVFHLNVGDVIEQESLSLYLTGNSVISFQEKKEDFFNKLRERLGQKGSKIQALGTDYLFIRLIDTVVDNYFTVQDYYETKGDELEELLFENYELVNLQEVYQMKRELKVFKKSVSALKEAVYQLIKDKNPLINPGNEKFVFDVHDHLIHINEGVDSTIEMYNGLMNAYDSHANNKLNQIMKVLTILSSIFIPITFLAGIYGMNFENIPELKSDNGYFILLGVMGLSTILMLLFFKKKRWL